ncbi:MAG: hypothetical protein M1817_002373 [Caeruleum heppii]|nr:MAG: hypothetical protein M1817_002373 [Caeruleum heppii]
MSGQGAGAMGPPSRPADKPTDISELTDVLGQAGVDMRDEENALIAEFSRGQTQSGRFTAQPPSQHAAGPSLPAPPTGGIWTGLRPPPQNLPGGHFGQSVFTGPAQPYRDPNEVAEEEHRAAVRRREQVKAYHLHDPFLSGNSLRTKIIKRVNDNHLRWPHDGFREQAPSLGAVNSTSIVGTDGTSIQAVTAKFIDKDAPMAELMTLVSLAAAERVRGLIEDAASLAKGRRVGAHGLVPPEWADLAVGNGTAESIIATTLPANKMGWEVPAISTANPLKRSHAAANQLPSPNSSPDTDPPSTTTISFPNTLTKSLRTFTSSERNAEEDRVSKRTRRATSVATAGNPSTSATPSATAPSTPGGPGLIAPDVAEPAITASTAKKLTKKEMAKQASQRMDVAHQQQSANMTARMMLGGGGGRFGKKYSWMTGGSGASGGGGGVGGLGSAGGGKLGASGAGGTGTDAGQLGGGGKRMGEWREDKERGAGIQLRDWVGALENDAKEKTSLARSYGALK